MAADLHSKSNLQNPITSAPATQSTAAPPQPTNPSGTTQPRPQKRQRRPSVRLGEIGDQPATISHDTHLARAKRQSFPHPKNSTLPKAIKAQPVVTLVNGNDVADSPELEPLQNGDVVIELDQGRKAKAGNTKRGKSIWVSKIENQGGEGKSVQEEEEREGFREINPDSDSQMKVQESPLRSIEGARWGVKGTGEGVKSWLIDLGLGRYTSVFEVHEVDDEVLPLLTLEDLKDMGITAVGSRRKLYNAIQKLRNEIS